MSARRIEVWADWVGLGGPRLTGVLQATPGRGRELFAFAYDAAWLARPDALALDPGLALYEGLQYPPASRASFGVFLDSCPDRWGRVLMQRREALRAREEGRRPGTLRESDYLLGVDDGQRMGGLRFRTDGPFLDDDELATPPWTSLPALERASLALEGDDAEALPDYARWLRMLVAPGSSLGGARPKASVVDREGRLWLAKLPSRHDDRDVGAWEGVAHELARRAGVDVPQGRLERFGSRHHTWLSRRFDRRPDGRVHFASALTMLERRDGDDARSGASYLELAEVLVQLGADTASDLEKLWRRIAFSIRIHNGDDHLRNHGFLLADGGWRLAPAYDLNPNPQATGLSLNVTEADNALELDLLREVAPWFRVGGRRQETILGEVTAAVASWRDVARGLGLGRAEQERMAPAFTG